MASNRKGVLELFKVAGVQVEIDYSWLIIFVLILWSLSAGYFPVMYPGHEWPSYWAVGLVATLLFFASVLIHELSHAAVGNRLGENISRITLFIFGGMAHMSGEPKSARDELKIAAVGPLSSLILGVAFWLISKGVAFSPAPVLWVAMFRYLAFINVALAVFNLLPGFPLDGGRLLRAVLWQRSGDLRKATAQAADWGNGIAWGLIGLGALEIFAGALIGGLWLIFIGLFLRSAASASYQSVVVEQVLSEARVSDIMVREPVSLSPDLSIADAVEEYFLRYGYGGFPVVTEGQVLGILSLSSVRHCPAADRSQKKVRDIMRPRDAGIEISRSATVSEAMRRIIESETGRLLVMDGEHLMGLITRTGITRFIHFRTLLAAPESSAGANV
jgi:Zn-dependent protease/predicted transcriptional regulator